jgi:hypothetical protein
MATIEIERDDWLQFFKSFTRRHEGWLVTLEYLHPNLGDQIEVEGLPLGGISLETTDRDRIELSLFGNQRDHLTHVIEGPRHVWLKTSDQGADEVLELESEQGVVLVRFHSAMMPEQVDGIG